MSMFVCSLNSGSNANCYFVGTQEEAILVDAGLSCRETVKRLKRIGRSIQEVKGIFVSHEHSDHISGIPVLARKYKIPVYLTARTLDRMGDAVAEEHVRRIEPGGITHIGALAVSAFPKQHDACDPLSFVVASGAVRVGVFTDIGEPCEHVIRHFSQCHAAFLETNYDEGMLMRGRYPIHLKRRILGAQGHLSNDQALDLFVQHRPPYMTHLFLSHLSQENNSPQIVKNTFARVAADTEIIVTSRKKETALYQIRHDPARKTMPKPAVPLPVSPRYGQLSLFG